MKVTSPSSLDIHTSRHVVVKILFFLAIYVYIFQPPIINKAIYVFVNMSFLGFFILTKTKKFFSYIKCLRFEICIAFSIVLISVLRDFFSGDIVYSDRFLVWFFQSLIFPVFVIYYFSKYYGNDSHNFDVSNKFIKLIYYVVVLAAFLTLLLMLFPPFDNFYKSIQLDDYYERYKNWEFRYRAYGISENLTFTYGYLLGLFAAFSLLKIKDGFHHFFFFLILTIGTAFNARIGFFPIIFALFYLITIGFNIKFFSLSIIAFIPAFVIFFTYFTELEEFLTWPLKFFEEILNFFSSGDGGTANTLLDDFIIVPNNPIELFFGQGVSLFGLESGSSDMGYILQLNYAGIFFVFLIINFLLLCCINLYIRIGYRHCFFWMFSFSVFLLNTKGFFLAATPGARLLFLIYCYYIVSNTDFLKFSKKSC